MQRILVVDDEEAILSLLSRLLTLAGYQVSTAPNGCQALDILARKTFDLMLLDQQMPGMSGQEVLKELEGYNSKPRIVLITGVGQDEKGSAEKLDTAYRLQKPFTPTALLETVSKVLAT